MAILRGNPYAAFNYRVSIGGAPVAGFCEISGLCADVAVVEYREGSDPDNAVRKMPGLVKYADVTLKRGLVGSLDLWNWFDQVRNGVQARQDVRIELLSEDRAQTAMAWRLRNAFPVKYCGPKLAAHGTDLAMEELVLAYERLEVE